MTVVVMSMPMGMVEVIVTCFILKENIMDVELISILIYMSLHSSIFFVCWHTQIQLSSSLWTLQSITISPTKCSDFEGYGVTKHLRHGQQPEGITRIKGEPTIEPYWAAGFSFSRGHFIINVPYDQHLPWVFQGEEISISLRGFTYGYDYYAPEHSICFHYYASADKTGKRNKVNLFWEHSSTFTQKGNVVEKKGMMRLNGILNMNPPTVKDDEWLHDDEELYGLGKVRSTQKFFDTFGIDTKEQKIEHHLCRFVGKNMQKKWKPYLRKDTMGIDYDKIDYKFKDPDVYGITW